MTIMLKIGFKRTNRVLNVQQYLTQEEEKSSIKDRNVGHKNKENYAIAQDYLFSSWKGDVILLPQQNCISPTLKCYRTIHP